MNTLFRFDNSYARLPDAFYARLTPTPVAAPKLVRVNCELADLLNLDAKVLAEPESVEVLAGNRVPDGAEPLAMAYAGHQFGSFVPQLGDGRAILLGEVIGKDGVRRDIQLKGAGRTPFSRRGDGRAVLGPVLREYLVSEAMAALGIPATRALAAVMTGEAVMREALLPGAVLTRVAESHVRVGTFQYFAARGDRDAVKALADYVIARHYPDAAEAPNPYLVFLDRVIQRQARLVALWLGVGFIHGVMNTDNTSIAGETIDFGPCAFMDTFHPETVFSSIDAGGRYAYGNQPRIAHWNLMCLAQAMLGLLGGSEEQAIVEGQRAIDRFGTLFGAAWLDVMRRKIGLMDAREGDQELIQGLLTAMAEGEADFTLTFRRLSAAGSSPGEADDAVRAQFRDSALFDRWAETWRERLGFENSRDDDRQAMMREANPAFIPRNHLVEEAIAAAYSGDFKPFEDLLQVLSRPYDDQPGAERFMAPPRPDQIVRETFCGT